jgi:hypothetical protein
MEFRCNLDRCDVDAFKDARFGEEKEQHDLACDLSRQTL